LVAVDLFLYKKLYNWEDGMEVVGYSAARQRLAKLMDAVVDDRHPVIVTRRGSRSVVMLALEEYEAMAATLHLLRNPKNARRLQKAIRDANARRFVRNPRT
jgi:antitoxin YefM